MALNGTKTIATFPASEILKQVGTGATFKTDVRGKIYVSKLSSVRLKTFQKSTECVCCGRKGTVLGLDLPPNTTRPHFNLYCVEGNDMILMTKDHIIPKSRGGNNHISNMQTMCCDCNLNKADKSPEEYVLFLEKQKKQGLLSA